MRAPKLTLAERNELRSICILTVVDHRVFINGAWPAYDFLAPNGERDRSVTNSHRPLRFCLLCRLHLRRTRDTPHHCEGRSHPQLHNADGCLSVLLPGAPNVRRRLGMDPCALLTGRCDVRRLYSRRELVIRPSRLT